MDAFSYWRSFKSSSELGRRTNDAFGLKVCSNDMMVQQNEGGRLLRRCGDDRLELARTSERNGLLAFPNACK